MKVFLCVVLLSLALGAMAQMGEPDPATPMTLAQLRAGIEQLKRDVAKMAANTKRYAKIGKNTVDLAESVMVAVDPVRRRCLHLENLRPKPMPFEKFPEVPLQPLEGAPLSITQLSSRIHALTRDVNKVEAATRRYVGIGKSNIGLMQRFAETSRSAICGADHHHRCPMGFVYNAVADNCFREVVGRYKNFAHAQRTCHKRGGHLPRVQNMEKNNALPGLLQYGGGSANPHHNPHCLWLGLQYNETDSGGLWSWVHPEHPDDPIDTADFDNFNTATNDPDKACACLCTMSNKWLKVSCTETQTRVLCEKQKNPEPVAAADDDDDDDDSKK